MDARGIRLGTWLNEGTVSDIAYYYGLLSHRRKSRAWKGIVHVDLDPGQDDFVRQFLDYETRRRGWT